MNLENKTTMEKSRKGCTNLYYIVTMGLFSAILILLGLFAVCSTSFIQADVSEHTFFVEDSVWGNTASVSAVLVIAVVVKQIPAVQRVFLKVEQDETLFFKYRNNLLRTGFLIAVFWVLSTQFRSGADQAKVQTAVNMLHLKDYSMFAEDGYLSKYPNQLGLVWISYLFSLIFGSYNYIGLQLANACGLVIIYKKLADISAHCGQTRAVQLEVILGGILFIPLTMYSSFVYGNVLGLACSLFALEREMAYFANRRKLDAFASAVLIALAILLKSNYLIFFIGMVIYAGLEWLRENNVQLLLIPVLLIVTSLGSSMAVNVVTEHVTGYSMDQGASTWSWVAMGLQEGKRAPGWYNGYNSKSYIESEYCSSVQAEAAKENIRESIERFSYDKWGALQFFTEKTASQWNNPTFQAFWNVQIRSSMVTQSEWVSEMMSPDGTHRWAEMLNIMQFLILAGALMSCVMCRNRNQREKWSILALIFVGGFLFHLFWEAKCQYTISYFVLLIPYAAEGFETAVEKIGAVYSGKKRICVKQWLNSLLEKQFAVIVFAFVLVNLLIFAYGGGKMGYLKGDTLEYQNYLEECRLAALEEEQF